MANLASSPHPQGHRTENPDSRKCSPKLCCLMTATSYARWRAQTAQSETRRPELYRIAASHRDLRQRAYVENFGLTSRSPRPTAVSVPTGRRSHRQNTAAPAGDLAVPTT